MQYCYIRVSTDKQEFDRQTNIFKNAGYIDGINCQYIEETFTGKTIKRPVLDELINKMQPGDTLVVESLTRLSRAGVIKTLEEVKNLLNIKKINVVILKENFNLRGGENIDANTKMLLGIFSILAEFERDLISERTKEALQAKKINGTKSGKPIGRPSTKKSDFDNLITTMQLIKDGSSYRDACSLTNYPISSLIYKIKQYKNKYDSSDLNVIIEKLKKEGA